MERLPVYGLGPEWVGPRVIMDFYFSGDEVLGVSMRHGGNVWGVGSQLIVKTIAEDAADGGIPLVIVSGYHWRKARGSDEPPLYEPEDLELLQRLETWTSEIEIDGESLTADLAREGREWVARLEYQGRLISLQAHDFDPDGLRLFRMNESDWPRQPRDGPPL